MTVNISVHISMQEFLRTLRNVSGRKIPTVIAEALNRTALDVIDAEKREIALLFDLKSRSRSFFTGRTSFDRDRASRDRLFVEVQPRAKTRQILIDHARLVRFDPVTGRSGQTARRLSIGPAIASPGDAKKLLRTHLAIPLSGKNLRGPSGRVRKSRAPAVILEPGKGGFIVRKQGKLFLAYRKPSRRKNKLKRRRKGSPAPKSELLYHLAPVAQLRIPFMFADVAERTARRHFTRQLKRAAKKILSGRIR